jgi:predicted aspartyl protease
MIVGAVNAWREAVIRLPLRGPRGQEQEIELVLDTGFSGSLTLPPALIAVFTAIPITWRRNPRRRQRD